MSLISVGLHREHIVREEGREGGEKKREGVWLTIVLNVNCCNIFKETFDYFLPTKPYQMEKKGSLPLYHHVSITRSCRHKLNQKALGSPTKHNEHAMSRELCEICKPGKNTTTTTAYMEV